MAYQPLPFEGTLTPEQVVVAMGFGGDIGTLGGTHAMLREYGALRPGGRRLRIGAGRACPDIEVLDVRTGQWVQFAHMAGGQVYELENAARWVNPASGQVQVKFVNEKQDGIGFQFQLQITRDRQVSAIVHAAGLVKRYDRTLAVAGLDLDVEEGEIFGLVGPNGAGKTTTLRILATLLVPDAGDAEIAGFSLRRNPNDVRRVIGFMPDSFGVYDDMKVWEYLDFFARCYGIPADRRRRMIGDLLDLVDLGPKRDTYVQGLSRGMQQRLCLAHALVHDPRVLLLDEPASGLDPRARVELRELLRELRTLGKTILVSSTSSPSSRSCARRSRSSTAARCSPRAVSPTSSAGCGSEPSTASASSATTTAIVAAQALVRGQHERGLGAGPRRRHDRDRASTATTRAPRRCSPRRSRADLRIATFARRRERPRGAVPAGHRPGPGRRREPWRERRRARRRSAAFGGAAGRGLRASPRSASRSSAAGCAVGARSSCSRSTCSSSRASPG